MISICPRKKRVCFLQLTLGACAFLSIAIDSATAQSTTRDSAGIRIVQHGDHVTSPLAFLVDTTPAVRIGGQNADLRYEIVRTQSAAILANGNIAVAMSADVEVRIFDRSGKYLRAVGRRGRGPGEVSQATSVARGPGTSFIVFDQLLKRSTLFTGEGQFVRLMRSPTAVHCCLTDSSFLSVAYRRTSSTNEPGSWAAIRVGGDSTRTTHDTLAFFPGSDPMLDYSASSMQAGAGAVTTARMSLPAPFGRVSTLLPHGAGFLVGDGAEFELREYSSTGKLARVIRVAGKPVAITSSMQRRYEAEALRGVTGVRRSNELAAMRAFKYPATAPAFRKILTDLERRIWVELYPMPGAVRATWIVFAPDGALVGRAETPLDQTVVSVGRSELLTLKRNAVEGTTMVNVLPFRKAR